MEQDQAASVVPPDALDLNRKGLQAYLKQWKCKATGTTVVLRERYEEYRQQLLSSATGTASVARVPAATATTRTTPKVIKKEKPVKEKRLRPFRPSASRAVRDRIARARTQRLYLVQRSEPNEEELTCQFIVLGSTGNVYTVVIGKSPSCSCPDHLKGNLCKHILFVLLKVVGLESDCPLIYQAALLSTEVRDIFRRLADRRVGGAVMAHASVQQAYAALDGDNNQDKGVARKSLEADSDCPICFDEMSPDNLSRLTYCQGSCGANFHKDCIERWLNQSHHVTCPNCRQPWMDGGKPRAKRGITTSSHQYTNLGALQRSERPTQRIRID